jgi:hypothetical protein
MSMPMPAAHEHHLVGRHALVTHQAVGQDAGEDWRNERAGIDAHVEDGESGIAALVTACIQLANLRRDVRLEQAVADDDRGQADQEHGLVGHHHTNRPGCHETTAPTRIERWYPITRSATNPPKIAVA